MPYPETPGGLLDATCPIDFSHPLNRGLVGCWAVTPLPGWRGGFTFRDLVRGGRNPHDGTLTGGPTWQGPAGRPGSYGSVGFDGSDDHVSLGTPAVTSPPCTVACWFRATDLSGNRNMLGPTSTGGTAIMRIAYNTSFQWIAQAFGNFGSGIASAGTPSAGRWYFVVGTFESRTSRHVYAFGQDGSYATGSDATDVGTLSGVDTLEMGRLNSGGSQSQWMYGRLDGGMLFSRALSAAEVRALYDESRRGYPEAWRWVQARAWSIPPAAGGTAYAWWAQQQGGSALGSGVL